MAVVLYIDRIQSGVEDGIISPMCSKMIFGVIQPLVFGSGIGR